MLKEQFNILSLGKDITIFVISGGPCGGKTTCLARLVEWLTNRGYKVLVVPETATKLIGAGLTPGELPWPEFQEEIFLDTLNQENRIFSIAARYRDKGQRVVVLCDRGVMDGEAYVGSEEFGKLIKRHGYTRRELCDGRYHAVMHLVTAANGAEEHYTLANNAARKESAEEARALDIRTLNAWTGHEHPRMIDNSTGFDEKIRRAFAEVCAVLGDPIPEERERKYLIGSFDLSVIPVDFRESMILQDYLMSPVKGEERRLRARGDGESSTYYYTIKKEISPGVRAEDQSRVQLGEYRVLLSLRDPETITLKKRRICFFWKGQFFEVDTFQDEREGLNFMEAEHTNQTFSAELPPFFRIIKDVTDDKRFSNSSVARKDWFMPAL